jgi:chitin-binding protein
VRTLKLNHSPSFYTQAPYHSHVAEMAEKELHKVKMPANKRGQHVIVLLWIVVNTGKAVYQAFDVDFK